MVCRDSTIRVLAYPHDRKTHMGAAQSESVPKGSGEICQAPLNGSSRSSITSRTSRLTRTVVTKTIPPTVGLSKRRTAIPKKRPEVARYRRSLSRPGIRCVTNTARSPRASLTSPRVRTASVHAGTSLAVETFIPFTASAIEKYSSSAAVAVLPATIAGHSLDTTSSRYRSIALRARATPSWSSTYPTYLHNSANPRASRFTARSVSMNCIQTVMTVKPVRTLYSVPIAVTNAPRLLTSV